MAEKRQYSIIRGLTGTLRRLLGREDQLIAKHYFKGEYLDWANPTVQESFLSIPEVRARLIERAEELEEMED